MKNGNSVVYLGVFLGAVSLLAALALGVVSDVVAEPLAKAEAASFERSLRTLVPDFDGTPGDGKTTFDGITFMTARKNGEIAAVFASGETKSGYGGPISYLVAISPDGKVIGVVITRHGETPGLGAALCERKLARTARTLFSRTPAPRLIPNRFLDQFAGMTRGVEPLAVTKDGGTVEYRTGATVTSRALTSAVSDVLDVYSRHAGEITKGR
ncbi:MAG: FMN-binding protein [Victivallaceae bacterium]|nr:FMN-binding protein [Victivallaceae bacterium]